MNEDQIRGVLDRLGRALSSGDLKAIAVAAMDEIERFFAGAIEWYRSRGLTTTRPDVERIDRLSDRLSAVDVRWPAFDPPGSEQATERSHYILRLGDDGQPHIRVALTRPA